MARKDPKYRLKTINAETREVLDTWTLYDSLNITEEEMARQDPKYRLKTINAEAREVLDT